MLCSHFKQFSSWMIYFSLPYSVVVLLALYESQFTELCHHGLVVSVIRSQPNWFLWTRGKECFVKFHFGYPRAPAHRYQQLLTVIGKVILNSIIHNFLWDEITRPCSNFNTVLLKRRGWEITLDHFIMDVITNPCPILFECLVSLLGAWWRSICLKKAVHLYFLFTNDVVKHLFEE